MKIFSSRRNRIMILVFLLVVIFFFGLKSYFKIDEQNVEAVEKVKPLSLNWLSYNEGLTLAQKEGKYIMIYFYTDGCSWCKKMEGETFSDERVKKIFSDKFIIVKIDARSENKIIENGEEISERELAILYKVSAYPASWFLESNYSRVAPLMGYLAAEQFIPILDYISEGWHKSITFQEYMEKNN